MSRYIVTGARFIGSAILWTAVLALSLAVLVTSWWSSFANLFHWLE